MGTDMTKSLGVVCTTSKISTTGRRSLLQLVWLTAITLQFGMVNPFAGISRTFNQNAPLATSEPKTGRATSSTSTTLYQVWNPFAVPVDELEKDLTPTERSITSVVRNCGPAVVFVTSVWPSSSARRQRRGGRSQMENYERDSNLPQGMSLGSGSGFVIASDTTATYLCTNFHVIQQAYTIQTSVRQIEENIDELAKNVSRYVPSDVIDWTTDSIKCALKEDPLPQVFVRFNGEKTYNKCTIVNVETDLDLAVLKIDPTEGNNENDQNNTSSSSTTQAVPRPTVSFGSSSDLIVGQSVVAIGNPFGLDNTVTAGIVSAVNREFRAGTARTPANRPIRNVVQTDSSINPGNSGGPLITLKGDVIGINTAIITTSGSSAGIGFAVPSDQLKPIVEDIIREDRINKQGRPNQGWLGVSVIKQQQQQQKIPVSAMKGKKAGRTSQESEEEENKTIPSSILTQKIWVTKVELGSPAAVVGIRPIQLQETGIVEYGDAIVAVSGTNVSNLDELMQQLKDRVQGEQINLTLEDTKGERRVVYLTLGMKPTS